MEENLNPTQDAQPLEPLLNISGIENPEWIKEKLSYVLNGIPETLQSKTTDGETKEEVYSRMDYILERVAMVEDEHPSTATPEIELPQTADNEVADVQSVQESMHQKAELFFNEIQGLFAPGTLELRPQIHGQEYILRIAIDNETLPIIEHLSNCEIYTHNDIDEGPRSILLCTPWTSFFLQVINNRQKIIAKGPSLQVYHLFNPVKLRGNDLACYIEESALVRPSSQRVYMTSAAKMPTQYKNLPLKGFISEKAREYLSVFPKKVFDLHDWCNKNRHFRRFALDTTALE